MIMDRPVAMTMRRPAAGDSPRSKPSTTNQNDIASTSHERSVQRKAKAEARASQRDEALHQIPGGGLYPFREEKRQACERLQDEADRALPEDSQDDDCGDEGKRQRDPENPRGANPGHFGKPGKRDKQEQEQGEDVEETLDDNGGCRLRARRATKRVQGDDPGSIAGAERQDVVDELTHE
jgi:hypothetical protein